MQGRAKKGKACSSHAFWVLTLLASFATSSSGALGRHSPCRPGHTIRSPKLTPFLDALPIPAAIDVSDGNQLTLGTYKITQKLHSQLPPTILYAYGTSQATATYPGPSLVATRHKAAHVRFENHINDTTPFLVVDRTLHWARPPHGGVPTIAHLHGAEVQSESDGHPDAWITKFGDKGSTFVTQNYTYPNTQPPTLLWYHDHTIGITRINIVSGLLGLYFIRSPQEEPRDLPAGSYEVPLVLLDQNIWPNGSINFKDVGVSEFNHPNWCPENFGDTILVNGNAWPHLKVYPAKYRFRMLNAANARFFNLSLSDPSLVITQIGTDGGYLSSPLNLSSLLLPPASRADVIVDFSTVAAGRSVYMNNSAAAPFPLPKAAFSPPETNSVIEFRVLHLPSSVKLPKQVIPHSFGPDAAIPSNFATGRVDFYRNFTMQEFYDPVGAPIWSRFNNISWRGPVTETPKAGTIEIWDIINLTPDAHPVHVHLINFLLVHQQGFDQPSYEAGNCSLLVHFPDPSSCFIEPPQSPYANQVGWKDTIAVYPSAVTRFWMRWTPRLGGAFPFDATSSPGYAWHCHIVDHEDNEMMRPLIILPDIQLSRRAPEKNTLY